jgi:hypothetical protein
MHPFSCVSLFTRVQPALTIHMESSSNMHTRQDVDSCPTASALCRDTQPSEAFSAPTLGMQQITLQAWGHINILGYDVISKLALPDLSTFVSVPGHIYSYKHTEPRTMYGFAVRFRVPQHSRLARIDLSNEFGPRLLHA